jgi:hypothetical protein
MTTIQKMVRGCDGRFGIDLAVKGDWAAIGAYGVSSSTGAVYLYKHDGNHWVFMQSITTSDGGAYDEFGSAVEMSETGHLVVGARGDYEVYSGAVYLYTLNSTSTAWGDEQKIVASDGAEYDYSGSSVAMSETGHLVVGAPENDDMGDDSGAVYLYALNSTSNTWGDEQKIVASDGAEYDEFGSSVAMSETGHLVVGAPYDDDKGSASGSNDMGSNSGAVYLYMLNSTSNTWVDEQKIVASDGAAYDWFGHAVAMSGTGHLVVGADDSDKGNSGAVYLYMLNSTSNTWGDEQKIVASDGAAYDYFGHAVAFSGTGHLLVGAPWDDDDMDDFSGSVYAIGEGVSVSLFFNSCKIWI